MSDHEGSPRNVRGRAVGAEEVSEVIRLAGQSGVVTTAETWERVGRFARTWFDAMGPGARFWLKWDEGAWWCLLGTDVPRIVWSGSGASADAAVVDALSRVVSL